MNTLPLGSVITYASDDLSKLQSQGWSLCNGNQYSASQNPDLFAILGYANGGSGDQFYLPNLQGQFIRGSDTSSTPGKVMAATTFNPGFKCSVPHQPDDYHHVNSGAIGPASRDMVYWNSGSDKFTVEGGDKETRPVNVYFNYIIKVASTATAPVGSVIPYSGSDFNSPNDPWEACNGNSMKANAANTPLLKVIGLRFSQTTSTATFNLPNLAGIFIRGVDYPGQVDPDADVRFQAPDGTTGRHVGTLQAYGTSAKGLTVTIDHYTGNQGTMAVYPTLGNDNLHTSNLGYGASFNGGSDETRPNNANVQYYIKTQQGSGDDFPIGGIIAIPGTATLDANHWVLADGSSISRTAPNFSQLFPILQAQGGAPVWGYADGNSFNLPDFRGKFLRATDLTRGGVANPWGDPDRLTRSAQAANGVTQGTGSVQAFSTGNPRNPFTLNCQWQNDVVANAATAVGSQISKWDRGSRTFDVNGGDTITAPVSVAVNFWIKIA